ncbi:spore protease YyaC [Pseudobacteroides cellulosolvens]|uniref:Sporulation protein YyaC n=1 Tax=Pseudobacteroides cellulosolvens ATCC 35603 = DSM 2933 TaxID=398512 RepID=A0A0L6JUY9_9FIRM|nr:spore protease YyaC [Pseudobacteroides cellulosolvens]KNY29676.1 sporulation protein YyaC [Pseudobacteroides cellulosolvens ATCC 35603 = DSM 2933]
MSVETGLKQEFVDIKSQKALQFFSETLLTYIKKGLAEGFKSIVFVCIGTDRSTGDSLGPLVGYKLENNNYNNFYFHGTLKNPVHAKNLTDTIKLIETKYENPYVVAIDACLGQTDHVGYISIGEGSIKPGAGVNKELPPVGNMFITGIVNYGGFMDFLVLQNTRLCIVMDMADIISSGIKYVMWKLNNEYIKMQD